MQELYFLSRFPYNEKEMKVVLREQLAVCEPVCVCACVSVCMSPHQLLNALTSNFVCMSWHLNPSHWRSSHRFVCLYVHTPCRC
jgi:hypothetical protein